MSSKVEVAESPASAADEVARFGSTILRGVWPVEKLAVIRNAIAAYSDARLARVQAGGMELSERMYAAHGVGTFAAVVKMGLIRPGFLAELFRGSYFHELCKAYFGDDAFYASPNRLGFRNHDPLHSDRSFIPYHQDSYTQDQRTPRVLNCWIPLDPLAGSEAPGLEVVRNPCRPDFPRKDFGLRTENAAYDFITIAREAIVEEYGENFLAPEFSLGDGLVFSENVIHRTYVTPKMTKPRINFELRIFSANSLAPGVTVADLGPAAFRIA